MIILQVGRKLCCVGMVLGSWQPDAGFVEGVLVGRDLLGH